MYFILYYNLNCIVAMDWQSKETKRPSKKEVFYEKGADSVTCKTEKKRNVEKLMFAVQTRRTGKDEGKDQYLT